MVSPIGCSGVAIQRPTAGKFRRGSRRRRDEVLGEPHAHKITRPGARQPGLEALEHLVHHGLRLAHRQPADGEAGPLTQLLDPSQTFLAQPEVGTALEDGPETLAAGRIAGWTVRTIRLTA